MLKNPRSRIKSFDERRDLVVPGDFAHTIDYCVSYFVFEAKRSIEKHGYFAVALSGGSTPQAIYKKLATDASQAIDWSKVWLFWSDERCVPKNDPESNYHMAMQSGLSKLPIPSSNIFPMPSENNLEDNAKAYEKLIFSKTENGIFDLIMLGVGEDGHTASLFPLTHGLHADFRLVTPNFVPEKQLWRMSMTFDCINGAKQTVVIVTGQSKAAVIKKILCSNYDPDHLPAQQVGTQENKSLWILDQAAASLLTTNV